jgi:uncharacterized low-complexity protein
MEQKKNTKKIIGGSIVLGSIVGLGGLQANAAELFNYNDLGSGSEVRSQLLQSERVIDNAIELSCGEKSEKKAEGKASEHKCGEGKCGEEGKKAKSAEGAAVEGKAVEHKCGEGKCGEEGTSKKAKKASSKKESKATESKCGEGKCGGNE